MKTRCSICNHEHRKEIELHLLKGELSLREIGLMFEVSHSPLFRHKKNCMNDAILDILPPEIPEPKKIIPRKKVFLSGEEILGEFHTLINEAKNVMEDAKREGHENPSHILMAIDRINRILQNYISFMDIAKSNDGNNELQVWREIGAAIWGFVDSKGLRDEFEVELKRRGI